jgi:hypothetical protein
MATRQPSSIWFPSIIWRTPVDWCLIGVFNLHYVPLLPIKAFSSIHPQTTSQSGAYATPCVALVTLLSYMLNVFFRLCWAHWTLGTFWESPPAQAWVVRITWPGQRVRLFDGQARRSPTSTNTWARENGETSQESGRSKFDRCLKNS